METDFARIRRARSRIAIRTLLAALLLLSAASGCTLVRPASRWNPPSLAPVAGILVDSPDQLASAEASYAAGAGAEVNGNPACVDHYYAAATQAWPHYLAAAGNPNQRATELYHSSVQLLISSASRFGRLHPGQGIMMANGLMMPIAYHGFVWSPNDFHTFLPVGTYSSRHLTKRYAAPGVGVPYVVLTDNCLGRPFIRRGQPFGATAVLAPTPGGNFALTLYDPLRTTTTEAGLPLARDLSAPLAYANSREGETWLEDFLQPTRDESAEGIHMREPYQPGKIPVVFVHGLASDPQTWSQLVNDLQVNAELFPRYQIWLFRYDTGGPFLSSAAMLRRHLAGVRQAYDPTGCDGAMSQIVLVGHSMGGLLAKLQVTYSGDTVWQSAATRPLATIVTDPATRADLASAFYFAPSPDVGRVVFIATPHRGSVEAVRLAGRISSALVEEPPQWRARHAQLVRDNPGAFRPEVSRRIPTSVDLLEPDSEILEATTRLYFRPDVRLHTILGDAEWQPGVGPSDGVVAVSSARMYGVETELEVDARHTEILRHAATSRELAAILARHAAMATCVAEAPIDVAPPR